MVRWSKRYNVRSNGVCDKIVIYVLNFIAQERLARRKDDTSQFQNNLGMISIAGES